MGLWSRIAQRFSPVPRRNIVEFYEQMTVQLAERGLIRLPHQTPMEFARAVAVPEVIGITDKYHAVRFGNKELSRSEREQIERWLGVFTRRS